MYTVLEYRLARIHGSDGYRSKDLTRSILCTNFCLMSSKRGIFSRARGSRCGAPQREDGKTRRWRDRSELSSEAEREWRCQSLWARTFSLLVKNNSMCVLL
ncbi:hypothetical protein ACFX2F_039073 [Malus domestica]